MWWEWTVAGMCFAAGLLLALAVGLPFAIKLADWIYDLLW